MPRSKRRGEGDNMKKSALRNNQTLVNKINGKLYKYDAANSIVIELLTDEQVENGITPDTVAINDNNIVCFFVSEDPNWDEFKLEDGILYANNKPISTGDIQVKAIIAEGKDRVLLAVEPRDAELAANGYVDIFTYNPGKDKFVKAIRATVKLGDTLKNDEKLLVMRYSDIRTLTRKVDSVDDDGVVTKVDQEYDVLVENGILTFNKETGKAGKLAAPELLGDILDSTENEAGISIVFVSSKATNGFYDADDDDEDYDDDYEVDGTEIKDLDGSTLMVTANVSFEGFIDYTTCSKFDGVIESVKKAGSRLVVKTDKAIYEDGTPIASDKITISALKGYPYLVKNEKKDDTREIVMANDDYECKTVVLKYTTDRGVIATVA